MKLNSVLVVFGILVIALAVLLGLGSLGAFFYGLGAFAIKLIGGVVVWPLLGVALLGFLVGKFVVPLLFMAGVGLVVVGE